jgi:hypothetical protein
MAHDDQSRQLHARPFPHKAAQTGASRASHSAPVQRLPQLLASLVWTMRHSMAPYRQDQSQEHVAYSVGVDRQRDQEANQMSLQSAGRRDQDLYRQARFRESRVQQSMKPMMLVRFCRRNVIWTSQSGTLRCAWSLRDTTVKIKVREGLWNIRPRPCSYPTHGKDRWKTLYMKVGAYLTFLASY